jgi:hypothetical protein
MHYLPYNKSVITLKSDHHSTTYYCPLKHTNCHMFRSFDHQHECERNTAVENTDGVETACHATRVYTHITTRQYQYIHIYIYILKCSVHLAYQYTH